jgi:hypothetical protein
VWSPDSRYIAFWQSDEREVPVYQITDFSGQHPGYVKIPYPKVGDTNPTVRIGVIDVPDNTKKWMEVDLNEGYIPRLYWTSVAGQLGVVHLNRLQNHLKLFFYEANSGKGRLVMEEKSDTWIDVFDFFAGIYHYFFFPEDSEEFFWISDRDGWSHIYRYNYEGQVLNQVTQGEWEVVFVHAIDTKSKTIYPHNRDHQHWADRHHGRRDRSVGPCHGGKAECHTDKRPKERAGCRLAQRLAVFQLADSRHEAADHYPVPDQQHRPSHHAHKRSVQRAERLYT